jgi:hypothetical protein
LTATIHANPVEGFPILGTQLDCEGNDAEGSPASVLRALPQPHISELVGEYQSCLLYSLRHSRPSLCDSLQGHVRVSFFAKFVEGRRYRKVASLVIDYGCADGRFMMSPHGMAVSNTRDLSSSETRVNAGIRGWKLHLSE